MSAATSHVDATRSQLRDRVMGAVAELVAERPWRDVTMAEVATQAGVSRQTLYNSFGSRSDLAQAYVMHQADALSSIVEVAIREGEGDPHMALETALDLFFQVAVKHPFVSAITSRDGNEEFLALVTTKGAPLLVETSRKIGRAISDAWPQVEDADAELVAETLVRLAISHAAQPSAPPDVTARNMVRLLGPSIDALI